MSKLLQELQDQYKEYVDERDARKLLIVDINDLRLQHQDYLAMKEGGSDSEAEEDPFVLRMALRFACSLLREDVFNALCDRCVEQSGGLYGDFMADVCRV